MTVRLSEYKEGLLEQVAHFVDTFVAEQIRAVFVAGDNAAAELERLRAGEADEPAAADSRPTAAQWLRRFNELDPATRLQWAQWVLDESEIASRCFQMDHDGLRSDIGAAVVARDNAEARVAVLEARVGSAMTWIDRYESKNGGLMIILEQIKDSLTGVRCTDATPGASTSERFAVGVDPSAVSS